jgi:hypothetical protein
MVVIRTTIESTRLLTKSTARMQDCRKLHRISSPQSHRIFLITITLLSKLKVMSILTSLKYSQSLLRESRILVGEESAHLLLRKIHRNGLT